MAAQAVAKASDPKSDLLKSREAVSGRFSVSASLRTWEEVIIAELLNLLEKRRYDACK